MVNVMGSKEIVIKTLEFDKPERVPRQLWLLPWAKNNYPDQISEIRERFPDDIVNSAPVYKKPLRTEGDRYDVGIYIDEWGCKFENRHKGIIGQVKEPLIKN